MSDEDTTTAADVIKDVRVAMLTTVGEGGRLMSRPMATQEPFDGSAWFFVRSGSPVVTEVGANPEVGLTYAAKSSWLSLRGAGSVSADQGKKDELWNDWVEAWFPDGRTNPEIVLLEVACETGEVWDSPGGQAGQLLKMLKARVTGTSADDGGQNQESLDLT